MIEKTAKQMFKELLYTKYENAKWMTENGIVYRFGNTYIAFDFDTENIITYYDDYDGGKIEISPELYKAITKQMEELGWL